MKRTNILHTEQLHFPPPLTLKNEYLAKINIIQIESLVLKYCNSLIPSLPVLSVFPLHPRCGHISPRPQASDRELPRTLRRAFGHRASYSEDSGVTVSPHNSDMRDSHECIQRQVWGEKIITRQSSRTIIRRFDLVETRLEEACSVVQCDSSQPTYLEIICVRTDVAQIWVVVRWTWVDHKIIFDLVRNGFDLVSLF